MCKGGDKTKYFSVGRGSPLSPHKCISMKVVQNSTNYFVGFLLQEFRRIVIICQGEVTKNYLAVKLRQLETDTKNSFEKRNMHKYNCKEFVIKIPEEIKVQIFSREFLCYILLTPFFPSCAAGKRASLSESENVHHIAGFVNQIEFHIVRRREFPKHNMKGKEI